MKKSKSSVVATVCATLIMSSTVMPAFTFADDADSDVPDKLEFSIDNESSHTMTALFITSNDDPSWDKDILEDDIEPGDTVEVTIDDELPGCVYDIKAEYNDEDTEEMLDVDLCELDRGDAELVVQDDD